MSKQPNYVFDDELYHWGIKGQRWGERRFQNEDGSWTAEGRERYGKGDDARTKAKITYNTQKYKADLKSRANKEKATRSALEERHSIKENAKTMRLARKEQSKFDRLNKKENAKLDRQGRPKFGKSTKNMSDDDLAKAIDRLKLQAEYNKQYALATNPSGALAKADRFFEGPTGKFVSQLAIATLPNVTNTAVSKLLDSSLKYNNELDRQKAKLDMEKTRADIEKTKAETADKTKGMSELEKRSKEAEIERTLADANLKNATAAQQQSTAREKDSKLVGDDYSYHWVRDPKTGKTRLIWKRK